MSTDGGTGLRTAERGDLRLDEAALRWYCDESWLPFDSTAEVEPVAGVVGQDDAVEALRFGLEIGSAGHNVFIRGLTGTGRMTLVRQMLEEIRPACPVAGDRCYVHNFSRPDCPRLITLEPGQGIEFRRRMEGLIGFITRDLVPALSSDKLRARRAHLDETAQESMRNLGQPFEQELGEAGLALVPVQAGQTVQPTILPVIDGKPVPMDGFEERRQAGQVSEEDARRTLESIEEFEKRFQEVAERIHEIQAEHRASLQRLYETEARAALAKEVGAIVRDYPQSAVSVFLAELVDDLIKLRLARLGEDQEFVRLYRVNVLSSHEADEACPVVMENVPTLQNLLGSIEREFVVGGMIRSDHMMIRAGSLLRADGGFLILEARDVLTEPGAWKVLVRTLRTGNLDIAPNELAQFWAGPVLKPESIPVSVKVVLLGDPDLYALLDRYDRDFSHLFKVLADFDTTIPRDETAVRYYAGVLSKIVRDENLLPFSRGAVVALAEHGARIAARRDRLTTRFGRLADVAREASFVASKDGRQRVEVDDVRGAVARGKHRADLPARRFRELVTSGTIRIQVRDLEVGQVNGLAVTHAGPLTYGFPTRITATIGPGTAGALNIEREAQLSGAIHTKGFYILGGLMRHLLRLRHPLAFSASVAFEQSYGGIDGDSASGAEICCLLSALTGLPLRQELAMTGAIDQLGHILPVGAVTEKVEGFYDVCAADGLTGSQGVIVPKANTGDLMLRQDVVDACTAGRFHVYAVATIGEALELLTGYTAGERDAEDSYPEDSVLGRAESRARRYWAMVAQQGEGGQEEPAEEEPAPEDP